MATLWIDFYLGLVAFLVALWLVPLCKGLSRRFGVVDTPGPRKTHKGSIPLLGGVAIFASFNLVIFGHIIAGTLFSGSTHLSRYLPEFIQSRVSAAMETSPQLIVIAVAGLGFFLIGLLDDKKALSIRNRFLLEFLVAGALVAAGLRFDLGFMPVWLAMVITVFWIVGISNAFNLLDGLDGLVGGVVVICSCILVAVMIQGSQPYVAMFLIVLIGSTAGFLKHNIFPATIFMGSSGSLFLGYILSVSVVLATFIIEAASGAFSILMPILLLAVPLYDTASVVLIRLRDHRPIFKGDRKHIHHRLLSAGFSEKGAVFFIWLLTFMVGVSSLLLASTDLWASILIFVQIMLAFALIVLVKHIRLKTYINVDVTQSLGNLPSVETSLPDLTAKTIKHE